MRDKAVEVKNVVKIDDCFRQGYQTLIHTLYYILVTVLSLMNNQRIDVANAHCSIYIILIA